MIRCYMPVVILSNKSYKSRFGKTVAHSQLMQGTVVGGHSSKNVGAGAIEPEAEG
jgi:S-adenosylmethionine synthetase